MTYLEAIDYVGAARRFGMKLGLDSMRKIARQLGDPQRRLRFIHLAGTNGKGSTAAFVDSCLRAGGHRTGLYTSPHLVSLRERVQLDRRPIGEANFAMGMAAVRTAIEACGDVEPTFFEILTALALWYFAREKTEWVVWETGLGGRLDATNIVDPAVCIVTNIGLDHTRYLGPTLVDIAREKAGIVKSGVPVIAGVTDPDARRAIREQVSDPALFVDLSSTAATFSNGGIRAGRQRMIFEGREYALGLLGPHQVANAACALLALGRPELGLRLTEAQLARGLADTGWPGRFQIVAESPLIVLDGAHNSAAVEMLLATWTDFLAHRPDNGAGAHLVFGSVSDKDVSEMAQRFLPHFDRISLVRSSNERSADPADLVAFFPGRRCEAFDSVDSFQIHARLAPDPRPTLVTGSLFLVGEFLALGDDKKDDFRLNERLEATLPSL